MKASIFYTTILIITLTVISHVSMAQEETTTRYVKVDSSSPDAIVNDGTDIFESKPLCKLHMNEKVVLLNETDGEYVKIRVKCDGKTIEGWVKSIILNKEPLRLNLKVSESTGAKSAAQGSKGSIDYEPIDTTGMRARTKVEAPLGTGRTTGVIGTVPITNTGTEPILITPQSFYIPSNGKYQSYVGRIVPGQSVPPGQTASVPVTGYCVDVHKPPVPQGVSMPPIASWVSVRNPAIPRGAPPTGIGIVNGKELEPFHPSDIPSLSDLPGFNKQKHDNDITIIPVWPGTNIPVGGTIDMEKNIREFAPVIVDAVMRIEKAAFEMIGNGTAQTPFSGDDKREMDALTQQTVWMAISGLVGDDYAKEDFGNQIISQYESNTGTNYGAAPEEVKENIEGGIDQFWSAFQLVGLEAKVISMSGSEVDLSNVKAHTDAAANEAADKSSAEAIAIGGAYVNPGVGDIPTSSEGAHVAQSLAVSSVYDEVNDIDDYDGLGDGGTGRKKYDEYTEERELNGKTHEQACKKIGIKADSSMGKSFKRVYNKQKS